MASVKVDKGAVEATDYLEWVSETEWHLLLGARRMFVRVNLPNDCRQLLRFVEEARKEVRPGQTWLEAMGFADIADFIERGLEIEPDLVEWAIEGLRALSPDEAVPLDVAVEEGKRQLGQHGGVRPGAGRPALDEQSDPAPESDRTIQADNISLNRPTHGTGKAYTIARLRRDGHDELAEAVEAGEMSARAAGIEAGFVRKSLQLQGVSPIRDAERIREMFGDNYADNLHHALRPS